VKEIQKIPGSEEYLARIHELQENLHNYVENPRLVKTAEELEALEQAIQEETKKLAALIIGQQVQASLDSEELQEAENTLARDGRHHGSNIMKVRVFGFGQPRVLKSGSRRDTSDEKLSVQAREGTKASISAYSCWESMIVAHPASLPRSACYPPCSVR
jgi:hypothetical protein